MMTIDAIARWIVPGLLNGIWQSFLIVCIVTLGLRYIQLSASTRYLVWFLLLITTVSLPFLPAKNFLQKNEEVLVESATVNAPNEQGTAKSPPQIPARVARMILLLWLGGAVIQMARLFVGLRRLFQLKRSALRLAVRDQYPRNAQIYSSDHCTTPVVIGFRRPVILIPVKLAFALPAADINRILRHEVAHIVRRDDWTQLAQRMMEALFFFHPVILWIGRKLILEREIACDDHVIKNHSDIKRYAKSLIQLAELNCSSVAPAAPAIFSHKNQLSRRIDMLLISNRNRSVRVSRSGLAFVILLVIAFVLFMAQVSPVIAVSEKKEPKIPKAQKQNLQQAEEELRRATEEMRRASETMQHSLEQMKVAIEELRALTTENPGPALAPLPVMPSVSPMPPLEPALTPPPALPTPEIIPTPENLPAPAIAPLPPLDANLPMPPDAKIIDPVREEEEKEEDDEEEHDEEEEER